MKNPALSVIMAVYNKAGLLERSIRSVLAQTFEDFELLLIDDGSEDESPAICREFARIDSRIRLIRQENGGVSAARQTGISQARGRYSIHIDPDDWVDPGCFEAMYHAAAACGADMVICDFLVETDDGTHYKEQKPSGPGHDAVLEDLFGRLHGSVCNKLIRHACYRAYGIAFPAGLDYCEDFVVCASLLAHPIRVVYLEKAFYHYDCTQANDSLTNGFSRRHLEASKRVAQELKIRLSGSARCDELVRRYEQRVKFMAFENRLLSAREFRSLFPDTAEDAVSLDTSRLNRLLFWGACHGFYDLCALLLHTKNRLRGNKLR